MNRLDRAILWLADRMPVSLLFLLPIVLVLTTVESPIIHRLAGPTSTWGIWLGWMPFGCAHGYLAVRVAQVWYRRHGLRQCLDCFRIGRWAIRITPHRDDSLAILEPPPWCYTGCWCRKHAMNHLIAFLRPALMSYYSDVALVPYDRNWGREVREERQRRDA